MSYFAIAGLQLALGSKDNLSEISQAIRAVTQRFPWIQMVVFGELASKGVDLSLAEPVNGPLEQHYCHLARELGIWIVPGSYYEKSADKIYNTTPVINPEGEVVSRYRKIYPFLPYEKGVQSGNEFVVFDIPDIGRFGLSICYDGWFPETTRSLVSMGAEVIIHPTLTNTNDRQQELIMARANAIMNQCYFVDINLAAPLGNGLSIVCDYTGSVVHQAGEQQESLLFEVDLAALRRSREKGLKGLGQPLKSWRDNPVVFPAYDARPSYSEALSALGELAVPRISE